MALYEPGSFDSENILSFLLEELEKLAIAIQLLEDLPIVERDVAPTRPRNGLYFADGTNWNPGSGRGLYRYDENTSGYVFLA